MPMSPRLLRPLASRATAIDPASVPGLFAWWDAADASTVTLDGGRVASIASKSGLGGDMANSGSGSTQPDYDLGAVNGRNAARYTSASGSRLQVAGSFSTYNFVHNGSNAFIAAVFVNLSPGVGFLLSNGLGLNAGLAGHSIWHTGSGGQVQMAITSGSAVVASATAAAGAAPQASPFVMAFAVDADNSTSASRIVARVNNTLFTSTGTATPTTNNSPRTLGSGRDGNGGGVLTGYFCEAMYFTEHPTQAHQDALFSYLARKWGVAV